MIGKTNIRTLCLAALALVVLVIGPLSGGQPKDFLLIAHSTVDQDSLTRAEASGYFLKKKTKWPDGRKIYPVDLNIRDVREAFSKEVHKRSLSAIKKYWQRQIFTGYGTPPPEKSSPAQVLDFVSSTPGAIGYVPADTRLPGDLVKTLTLR